MFIGPNVWPASAYLISRGTSVREAQLFCSLLRTYSVAGQKDELTIEEMCKWKRSAEVRVMVERQNRKEGGILARAGARVGPVSPPRQAEPYAHRSQTTPSQFCSTYSRLPSRLSRSSLGLALGHASESRTPFARTGSLTRTLTSASCFSASPGWRKPVKTRHMKSPQNAIQPSAPPQSVRAEQKRP